jgi:hypothetical protein
MASGVAIHDVEIDVPPLTSAAEVVETNDVGASGLGSLGLVALGKHATRTVLPVPAGSTTEPRTILIGLLGIHAEIDRHVDRLVELGGGALFHQVPGHPSQRIRLVAIDLGLQYALTRLEIFAMIRGPPR